MYMSPISATVQHARTVSLVMGMLTLASAAGNLLMPKTPANHWSMQCISVVQNLLPVA